MCAKKKCSGEDVEIRGDSWRCHLQGSQLLCRRRLAEASRATPRVSVMGTTGLRDFRSEDSRRMVTWNATDEAAARCRDEGVSSVPTGADEDVNMSVGELGVVLAVRWMLNNACLQGGLRRRTVTPIRSGACVFVRRCCVCDVAGIYAPPRFTPRCAVHGWSEAFFLHRFVDEEARRRLLGLDAAAGRAGIGKAPEGWAPVVLSIEPPLCASFCPVLCLNLMAEEIRERRRREGEPHLRVAADVYRRQLAPGKHSVHEHPACSESWNMPEIKVLVADPRVHVVQGPIYRWGTWQLDSEGFGFIRKETKWTTSSPLLAKKLQSVCSIFLVVLGTVM